MEVSDEFVPCLFRPSSQTKRWAERAETEISDNMCVLNVHMETEEKIPRLVEETRKNEYKYLSRSSYSANETVVKRYAENANRSFSASYRHMSVWTISPLFSDRTVRPSASSILIFHHWTFFPSHESDHAGNTLSSEDLPFSSCAISSSSIITTIAVPSVLATAPNLICIQRVNHRPWMTVRYVFTLEIFHSVGPTSISENSLM